MEKRCWYGVTFATACAISQFGAVAEAAVAPSRPAPRLATMSLAALLAFPQARSDQAPVVLPLNQVVNGSLDRDDASDSYGALQDRYTFVGHRGQRVEFLMNGGFDTYLRLNGPGVSSDNDDDAASSNPLRASRLTTTLPSDGVYILVATGLGRPRGRYTLIASDLDAPLAARSQAQAAAVAHVVAGGQLLSQSDARGAYREYTRAIRLDPGNAAAFSNRGVAQFRMGHYRFAAEDFETAGRIDPSFPNVESNRIAALRAEEDLQARRASGEGDWSGALLGVVSAVADAYIVNNGGTAVGRRPPAPARVP